MKSALLIYHICIFSYFVWPNYSAMDLYKTFKSCPIVYKSNYLLFSCLSWRVGGGRPSRRCLAPALRARSWRYFLVYQSYARRIKGRNTEYNRMYDIWRRRCECHGWELSFATRPSELSCFGTEERFWRLFPFLKDQTKINSSVSNTIVTEPFPTTFAWYFYPASWSNNHFWPYKERVQKPFLGCQNWVTAMGGFQKLVPGWHSQRRGPAWSVICTYLGMSLHHLSDMRTNHTLLDVI